MAMRKVELLAGLLLAGTLLALGLGGGFQFDDFPNIVDAPALHAQTFSLAALGPAVAEGLSGPTGRPISLLSFAVDHALYGLNPVAFKATNILLHLINGFLCYLLAVLLLKRSEQGLPSQLVHSLALVIALAWTLHPLQISSVLYVVQRMNELSALFSLTACIAYCAGRERLLRGERYGWAAIAASLTLLPLLAVLSKENGALTPVYLLVVELCFFRLKCASFRQRRALVAALTLLALAPLAAVFLYSVAHTSWFTSGYITRDFTLRERLLTEGRVLWTYLEHIVLPDPSKMGLYRDDYRRSTGWWTPATTLPALVGLGLLLIAAVGFAFRKQRVLGFGLLFFLTGHLIESTVIALELVFEHRNYLPSFGILFGLVAYAGPKIVTWLPTPWPRLCSALALVLLATLTGIRAYWWGEPLRWIRSEVVHHPTSPRAQRDLATALHHAASIEQDQGRRQTILEAAALHAAAATAFAPLQVEHTLTFLLIQNDLGQAPRDSFWELLHERVSLGMVSASAVSQLQALVQCQIEQVCAFKPAAVQSALETAANKSEVRAKDRAVLLHAAGVHAFWSTLDRNRGLQLMESAIHADPAQLRLRLSFIRALGLYGDRERALAELQAGRAVDTMNLLEQQWLGLENELEGQRVES